MKGTFVPRKRNLQQRTKLKYFITNRNIGYRDPLESRNEGQNPMDIRLTRVVDTIIASLAENERALVDRQRLSKFVRGQAEEGEPNLAIILLAGMKFVRKHQIAGV
jgi:hypothetical protein